MTELTLGLEETVTVGGVLDVLIAGRPEVNARTGFQFTMGGLTELNPARKDEIATMSAGGQAPDEAHDGLERQARAYTR